MRGAVNAGLALLHGLQQRALRPRRRAVHLVREDDFGKQRAGAEAETFMFALEDGYADDVGRQKIAGELDALKVEPQYPRERPGQRGLADAGNILDQKMPI